jgi:3-methyladenine DNA glycosylase/8-oxoguanine DNA glycosylase
VAAALEREVTPASPFLMPRFGGEDRVMRVRGGVATRLLDVDGSPVLVRAWQPQARRVLFRAEPVDPAAVTEPPHLLSQRARRAARDDDLRSAVERMRFALGVDEDLGEFYRRFRRDPLLGPLLRRRPDRRPHRRPWPWEALAWAIVKQLIESGRAASIQRRIVGRWGTRLERRAGEQASLVPRAASEARSIGWAGERVTLRDVPRPAAIAGRAPAELESMGLSAGRSIALRAVARDIAAGRCDPAERAADARFLRVPEIGPWTVQCLGFFGRGEPDSLPAGDLMFLKLVGRLARLGRRATVEEVEEFFAPYAPYRGLAGSWMVGH